ncbi:MAG: hypothetical protein R3F37_02670 [Candidatus Competibacteraceae bacterium]
MYWLGLLGNVIQGRPTTVPVSMDDMIYHCRNVAAAVIAPVDGGYAVW